MAVKKAQKRKKAAKAEPVIAAAVRTAAQAQEACAQPESVAMSAPIQEPAPAVATHASANTVSLASNCTVKDALALKHSLIALKDMQAGVVIDASAVERVDTATMQLLCAFVRERVGADREVTWHSPSAAVLEASKLLGVTELLCLPGSAEVAA
ncbi:MAG: lipid asymmetry maintenance protein MlaB [Povalibacter sp.]